MASPWTRPLASAPAPSPATAMPCDRVDLGPPPAGIEAEPQVSTKSKLLIAGAVLALGVAIAGAMPPGHAAAAPPASSIGATVSQSQRASTVDRELLKALDGSAQLTIKGRPADAFGALRALESGQPVGVGTARLGYHPGGSVSDPTNAQTADQIKEKYDQVVAPAVVTVRSFAQLQRLNAAEKLTDVDTGESLSQAEREMLEQISHFEGGVPEGRVITDKLNEGAIFTYYSELPKPGLMTEDHSGSFRISERLTALQAVESLQSGKPIVVRSTDGQEAVVHQPQELALLNRLEAPRPPDAPIQVNSERDVQEAIVRELAAGKLLHAPASTIFTLPTEVSAFQAAQMLDAGKPVEVTLGGGLTVTVHSMGDLARLNATEALTRVDNGGSLPRRDLKTLAALRIYEGRGANAQQSSLFGTKLTLWYKTEVPSSQRLTAQDALAKLNNGEHIAVRTHRGQTHIIHSIQELDTLATLVPAPPPPDGATTPPTDGTTSDGTAQPGTVPQDGTAQDGTVPQDGTQPATPEGQVPASDTPA